MRQSGTVETGIAANRADREVKPVRRLRSIEQDVMVVIPARDEAADVGRVVARVLERGLRVVVVDDYSGDRTAEIARHAGATVLQLPFHAGCWAAIQAGMRYALEHGCNYVVTLDADGQHDPADIDGLFRAMIEPGSANVIIGACPDRANRRRKLAWHVLRRLSGLEIDDLTSGFRVYDRRAIRLLASPKCTLLEYQDVGVLLCLLAEGLRISEIDVEMRPRRHGISRVFSSWPMVAYYLIYSSLIGGSRRRRRRGKDA